MRTRLLALLTLAACGSEGQTNVGADAGADAAPAVDAHQSEGAIIYLNFAGQDLQPGEEDDSAANVSRLITEATTIPPFDATDFAITQPQDVFIATITAHVRAFYDPFDVEIVTARPSGGDYVMAVIGGKPDDVGLPACTAKDPTCSLGTAWLDCAPFPNTEVGDVTYNVDGNRGIVFVFSDPFTFFPERPFHESALRIGATIAHELGHSFGLAHVEGEDCVMDRDSSGTTARFCEAPYNPLDGRCGRGDSQDAPAILREVFAGE